MKNSRNKKILFVLFTIITFFVVVVLYLVYFQLFKATKLAENSMNNRNYNSDPNFKRGNIYDSSNNLLTYSEKNSSGNFERINNYNYLYTNIIGYYSQLYGRTGIENYYNAELLNSSSNKDFISKFEDLYSKSLLGNDVYLTIDNNLQSYAYDMLGDQKGAVIVTDVKTGKILSMVSKPTYNVNKIDENWDKIISSKDGNMLNRATQGLYSPGSTYKIISAIALLEKGVDLNYNDVGVAKEKNLEVYNYKKRTYGELNLSQALQVSANTYFVDKTKLISGQTFKDIIDRYKLNTTDFEDFPKTESSYPYSNTMNSEDKALQSFGQGKLEFTPIDIHLITSSVANNGIVMKPYLVDKIQNKNRVNTRNPKIMSTPISSKTANTLKNYLVNTANANGVTLRNDISIGGKTGTAELSNKNVNSWYTAFAPADSPKYVVTVIIEDTDLSTNDLAIPIATKILNYLFSN